MNGTNSSAKHYDMVAIGSGAAGHHGAIQAAKLGKKIAVVERSIALGGASINTGTIPSKTLREAVLRSTRSGSTDRRISASNLAQRIEEVASNEVRVFESQFRRNEIGPVWCTSILLSPRASGWKMRRQRESSSIAWEMNTGNIPKLRERANKASIQRLAVLN